MTRFLVFILVPLLIPFNLLGQANYKIGNIVNLQADTIKGFINYREWIYNPAEVEFKPNVEENSIQKFTPAAIKAFQISGFESYESYPISISQNEVNYSRLTIEKDTTKIRRQVFLKLLVRGNRVSLYRYNDKMKERFYVLAYPNTVPTELQFFIQKKEDGIEETPTFRQQLNALALQHNVFNLSQQIAKLAYSGKEISSIIKQINTQNFTDVKTSAPKKQAITFFVGSGVNKGRMTYRGESRITVDRLNDNGFDKFKDQVETVSYLPVISIGVNYAVNPAIQRLIWRGELLVSPLRSNVISHYRVNSISNKDQENTYNLALTTLTAAPQLIYNIYNKEKLKFYLGGGPGFSYYLIHKDLLIIKQPDQNDPDTELSDYLKPKHLGLNILLKSGVIIANRFETGITYMNTYELSNFSSSKASSSRVNNLVFNFNYILHK